MDFVFPYIVCCDYVSKPRPTASGFIQFFYVKYALRKNNDLLTINLQCYTYELVYKSHHFLVIVNTAVSRFSTVHFITISHKHINMSTPKKNKKLNLVLYTHGSGKVTRIYIGHWTSWYVQPIANSSHTENMTTVRRAHFLITAVEGIYSPLFRLDNTRRINYEGNYYDENIVS